VAQHLAEIEERYTYWDRLNDVIAQVRARLPEVADGLLGGLSQEIQVREADAELLRMLATRPGIPGLFTLDHIGMALTSRGNFARLRLSPTPTLGEVSKDPRFIR
jgi:hypothetical protein